MERVQKLIAKAGICSRRKAEELIAEGKVKVNGITVSLGDQAEETDKILVNGSPLKIEPKVYYMLNKPKKLISTVRDLYGRKTVMTLLPKKLRIYPVGRLDRDATGLLLFTNDGDFANRIMHPSNEVDKTYIAVLDKPFNSKDAQTLAEGIKIDKMLVKGKIIKLDKATIAITIHSGLNKVVKRICKSLGYYVRKLHRTHLGNLALDVETGSYRELDKKDRELIFSKAKISRQTFQEQS